MSKLMIRTRRVKRTLVERVLQWERAYESEATEGLKSASARGKTREEAEAAALKTWKQDFESDCDCDAEA